MRYLASLYGVDTRPEKPEGYDKMSDADQKSARSKAKDGFRTKSGNRRIGQRAQIDAESFTDAIDKVAKLVDGLSDAALKDVVRLQIEADDSDPDTGGNPFAA